MAIPLHLGTCDIRLGPSLPAFVTPAVLQVLVDNSDIKPITTAQEDLAAIRRVTQAAGTEKQISLKPNVARNLPRTLFSTTGVNDEYVLLSV